MPNAARSSQSSPATRRAPRRLAALALTAAAVSALAAGPAVAAKSTGKPGTGGTGGTTAAPNLVVSTPWRLGAFPVRCDPILGGCTSPDGHVTLQWFRSGAPVDAGHDLPSSITVTNTGGVKSAATTGTFSFARVTETGVGQEDFRLYWAVVPGVRGTGTVSGTRGTSISFPVPSLAPGASVKVDLTYALYGAPGASIKGSGTTTSTRIAPVSGETSTADNTLTTTSGSYDGQG
jgi:hypothetical protein